jgi:predicted MPP superfamily phosphohydrolase
MVRNFRKDNSGGKVFQVAIFLLTFFLIYGGFHFYFFLKVRTAFCPGISVQLALIALLILGLMAPIIVRMCERYGWELAARLMAWAGYLWMAFLLLFFCSSVLLDISRLLVRVAAPALRNQVAAVLPADLLLLMIPAVLSLGIVVYGFFDARCIRSESLVIRSARIPQGAEPIRIVQISDVHVGLLVRDGYLEKILQKVREARPDVLVSTGDLLDGQGDNLDESAARLREIPARLGKYAITGNHEFYAGLDMALDFTQRAGFTMLRGTSVKVAGGAVALVGVDDLEVHGRRQNGSSADGAALKGAGSGLFTILLKHRPLVEKDAVGAFDLQLSGHTHKGQIYPVSLLTALAFPFHAGDYRLPGGGLLHVSRGSGTWGPPVRFLCPPEITVIDLLPEK